MTAQRLIVLKKSEDILHAGRLGSFSQDAAKYTSSIDIDDRLLAAVVAVNSAHMTMLAEKGIVEPAVARRVLDSLKHVPKDLKMKEDLEDVHMCVEDFVISQVGKEAGGMLNLGKSRNDQVATALRIVLREKLIVLGSSMVLLQKALLAQATKNAATPMPGYTHLQRGQPVTAGHHLLAYFESLDRDFARLVDCYLRTNESPMGSGALASSSFPLDRERVAELLGFDDVMKNSLDAVSSRDFAIEAIYLCTQTMTDLSRLAEEIVLWTTKEFGFADIADEYSSTSSMMPQKKNAIVPEIFRARTAQVLGDLVGSVGIVKALPLSYNLDLQELTRNLWSAMDKTISSIAILARVMNTLRFNPKTMLAATGDDFLYATELADYLVRKYNVSFREAHGRVGRFVKHCASNSIGFKQVDSKNLRELLSVEISQEELESITDSKASLEKKTATGSPSPNLVASSAKSNFKKVLKHENTLSSLEKSLTASQKKLWTEAGKVHGTSSRSTIQLERKGGER